MTEVRVPYGRSAATAELSDDIPVDIVDLPESPAAAYPTEAVRRALSAPLGAFEWVRCSGARSVAIAVNDKTRPVPHEYLLPPLLDRLARAGVADDAITFHIAVGGHPPMTPDEFGAVLPDPIVDRFRIVSHDAEHTPDLIELGTTSRGTPVVANRRYVGADVRIVVGTIEPHQFVGFSGGVKSAAIGLAGLATINANHTLMADPASVVGTYTGNPAREDVEEIGAMMGVDLALNAILDSRRAIVAVLAGDPVAVMKAGVPLVRERGQVAVHHRYSVVITSPGGHPKDINVYQAQKAVASAARIVRTGGTIILVAACPEGAGSPHYEQWVAGKRSRQEVVDAFAAEGFRLGPHKAFQLARDTAEARLLVCSEMPDEMARSLLLEPATDLPSAIAAASRDLAPGDRVAVLPHASSTVPYVVDDPSP